jgi:hypothetical protein
MPHISKKDKDLRDEFRRVGGFICKGGYTTKRNGVDVVFSTGYPSNFVMCFVIDKANDTLIPEELLDDILEEANIVEAKAIAKANELAEAKAASKAITADAAEAKAAFKVYIAAEANAARFAESAESARSTESARSAASAWSTESAASAWSAESAEAAESARSARSAESARSNWSDRLLGLIGLKKIDL